MFGHEFIDLGSRGRVGEGVTEDTIWCLVVTFYDRVLQDEELQPIFHKALAHRWSEHLAVRVGFWLYVALRTGRYKRKPQ